MAERNELSKVLSTYEYGAIVGPGALLLYGLMLLAPPTSPLLNPSGLTVGDLGVFLILAFVAGHVLQAVGNVMEEMVWWAAGGWPTERLLLGQTLGRGRSIRRLDEAQLGAIRQSLSDALQTDITFSKATAWDLVYRVMYADIAAAQQADRVDMANRAYGMLRGITVALFALAAVSMTLSSLNDDGLWSVGILLVALSGLTALRMVRFGRAYALELATAYLRGLGTRKT